MGRKPWSAWMQMAFRRNEHIFYFQVFFKFRCSGPLSTSKLRTAACGWAIIPPRVSKDLVSLGKARWWWKRFLFYRNSQSCCHGNIRRECLIQPSLKVLDQIILFSWRVWENTICWVPPPEILMLEVWGGAGTLHGQAPRWHRWCWASGPTCEHHKPSLPSIPSENCLARKPTW